MLKQKEFYSIVDEFNKNNMNGYWEWFYENVNCEVKEGKDESSEEWIKGVRLYSESKTYAVIAIEWFSGMAFRVPLDGFRMIESKLN